MSIDKVTKRTGGIVPFDRKRIEKAIYAAARAAGNGGGQPWAETMSWAVMGIIEERFGQNGHVPHVEEIQDLVEEVLIKSGHPQVAKAYILYRQKRAEARATERMLMDTEKLVDDYLQKLDWRVNENSNMNYSLQGLNFYLASSIAARYWLHKIYPPEVQQAHSEGEMHLHDLGMLSGYCCGWDLQDLLIQGFGGVPAKIESRPPKHLRTALGQLVNFFYTLQGEVAGAVAVSNFDTLLAPFIRYDKLDYVGIKQAVQEFVYNINVPTRVGFQSLVWEELVLVRRNGRIEPVEIGQVVDEQFERNRHRILSQSHSSFAVANADDVQALAFDADGSVRWVPVKAFVRHRVPQGSTFVRMRTSRGTAAVSQAHSMFAFEKLNGRCSIRPVAAHQVDVAHANASLTPTNHLVAVRRAPNGGTRARLDLVETIDSVPQLTDRVRVRLPDHVQAVERLKQRAQQRFGGLTAFYLEYGVKDKGCWRQWADSQSLPYRVWRSLGEDETNADLALRNSKLWYSRTLEGDPLVEFIRLLGWYITEGHNDITNGLYVSQARGGDQDEMMRVLGALGALGRVEETRGWPAQGNPAHPVLRMAGKGLLAALISFLGGTCSTNKAIPWFVYDLPRDLQETLIATLLRGDGSELLGHWDYTTTSRRLSLGLSLLLAMNGYKFSVYEASAERETWSDQYTLRIYKDKAAGEEYASGDLLGRVCSRREPLAYDREYEYDLSVDTPLENFAGGSGLLCFHNTPFTNITMDLTAPSTLRDQAVIIAGEPQEATYGEFQEEMDLLNRAFAEVMLEGDSHSRVFTFPIPTFNVTRDFQWDNPVLEPVWLMTAKYGIPYFCLEENTAVLLNDYTPIPIKSIHAGDLLVGPNGSPVLVAAVYRRKAQELVQVTLKSGQVISATPTHRFPTSGGLKEARTLSLDDRLVRSVPGSIHLGATNSTMNAREFGELFDLYTITENLEAVPVRPADLSAGQAVVICPKPFSHMAPRIAFEHKPDDHDTNSQALTLPERMTPEICRLLGYLVGDGYYAKSNSTVTFVSMDEAMLGDYAAIVQGLGLNYRLGQAGRSKVAKEIAVHSVALRQFLLQIGLHRVTARHKTVPQVIYQCPEEHVAQFLRGLFDTDGSVAQRPLINYTSVSETLVRQVQTLLLRMGIASHFRKTSRNCQLTITGENIRRFAQKIGAMHQEKCRRLEQHSKSSGRKALGEPLLNTRQQVANLVAAGRLPPHYRYSKAYQGYFRVPASALCHLLPGAAPVLGDYIVESSAAATDYEPIAKLQLVEGNFAVVDVTVDSEEHLFTLYGGILSHNSNYINSDMNPEDARSMCCRLRLDQRELRKRMGGLFAAAPLTGSAGVATINLPRIAYQSRDEADFQQRLEKLMEVARTSLEIKRKMLEQLTERGLYPYSRHYLRAVKAQTGGYWSHHFSTIGLIGMNEACLNLLGVGIAHPEGKELAVRTLSFMRDVLVRLQEETGNLYNLEATPAEGASYRLARADKKEYPDIITAGTEQTPYYTNSSHLPVGYSDDLFAVLDHQDDLQTLYTGGTVLHIFLGERLYDWKQARKLVRTVAENYRLPYFTITPTFSICPVHGYIAGEHKYCPYEHTPEQLERYGVEVRGC
jgi:anaerobic ribonucleoside-triphosphate reductase